MQSDNNEDKISCQSLCHYILTLFSWCLEGTWYCCHWTRRTGSDQTRRWCGDFGTYTGQNYPNLEVNFLWHWFYLFFAILVVAGIKLMVLMFGRLLIQTMKPILLLRYLIYSDSYFYCWNSPRTLPLVYFPIPPSTLNLLHLHLPRVESWSWLLRETKKWSCSFTWGQPHVPY